jgi:hypothetical protein
MKNEALNSVQEYVATCHDGAGNSTVLYLIRLKRAALPCKRATIFPVLQHPIVKPFGCTTIHQIASRFTSIFIFIFMLLEPS